MNPTTWISGWKTVLAAIAAVSLGVYLLTQGKYEEGVASIIAGLALLGIGGKIDKNTEAVKNS